MGREEEEAKPRPNRIDLAQRFKGQIWDENEAERVARLEEERAAANHKRRKDWWSFCVTVAAAVSTLAVSGCLSFWGGDAQRPYAQEIFKMLLPGVAGIWVGTKLKKE